MMIQRRALLRSTALAALAVGLRPAPARAVARGGARLALLNLHTGERLDVRGADLDEVAVGARRDIERVLRDHRSGATHPIDADLLRQLALLGAMLEFVGPFHVISGYRSPATNARLAARSAGVARGSLHQSGRAIDVRVPGVALASLHRAALSMQAGGVGYYAASDFVHLDTGRVRAW